MSRFPVAVFTRPRALLGYDDRYRSSLLAQKFAGFPKGIYLGFAPSVAPPSPILTLAPDGVEGVSVIKVPSNVDPGGVDIVLAASVTLDFTGQPGGDFPIHVLAKASYANDPAVPTSAEIFTRSAGPVSFDEVLICVVSGTPGALTVAADPALAERDSPLAYAGVDFGFMPAGAVEDLAAATDIVNEVTAARLALDSATYDSISARLEADQSAAAMSGRLGRYLVAVRSNDYLVGAGEQTINVSGSFSQVNRDHEPKITLGGQGSETEVGAVASPADAVRNTAVVIDAATGYRPVDDTTNLRIIFGRVVGPTEFSLAGVFNFTNAQKGVTVTDGQVADQAEAGDLVQGADGRFYEIASIFSNTQIELQDAYVGATASSGGLIGRRWELYLKKISGTSEIAASLSAATTIRFFFPAFLNNAQSNFDWRVAHMSPGGRQPLPDASTSIPGRVLLAQTGAKLGSVNVQSAGVPVVSSLSSGKFHTVNFIDGDGLVVQTGSGEVTVGKIGEQGAQGDPGLVGPPGPAGPDGPGFSEIAPCRRSGEFFNPWPYGTTTFTYSIAVGHTIRALAVQIGRYWDIGTFTMLESVEITSVSGVGSTTASVGFTLKGDSAARIIVSSAGD